MSSLTTGSDEESAHETVEDGDQIQVALDTAFAGTGVHFDRSEVHTVTVGAGDLLCDVGDRAETAWVVISGRLQASTLDSNGDEHTVGVLGPGELIGESALLDEGHRRARMRALRRSRLVELDRAWLITLLSERPDAAMAVVRAVVERADRPVPPSTGVIAIVPLDSNVVEEARLVAEFAATSSGHILVTPDDVPVGAPGKGFSGLADGFDRLDDMEREHGGVVLLADPANPSWTIAAAEVADRVIFVADAEDGPEIGDFEHHVLRSIPRQANATRMLLLVHPAETDRPRGTCDWLDRRELDRHLHLRRQTPADRHRVARHIIGRALTIAVGAGGVRSAGAVGTIRALAQRGIAVDAAAGVSGGAIIASLLAVSTSIDEVEDKTEWSMRKLLDYTLPIGAVISGKRAWSRIKEAADDRDIADAWLPLAIVTTNLTLGESVNHTRGPMADILYASISIPGVFPPVDIGGHLHVDGAVFDAIPVEGARQLVGDGQMIVVDFAPPIGRSTGALPRVMSGWKLLTRRLIPGVRSISVPNPLDTLMRSTTVASARRRVDALGAIDCHVHLNLSEFSVLEFDKVRRVVELGHVKSHDPLDNFLASDNPPLTDPTLAETQASAEPR